MSVIAPFRNQSYHCTCLQATACLWPWFSAFSTSSNHCRHRLSKLQHIPESLMTGWTPSRFGVGLRISNKFQSDASSLDQGPRFKKLCPWELLKTLESGHTRSVSTESLIVRLQTALECPPPTMIHSSEQPGLRNLGVDCKFSSPSSVCKGNTHFLSAQLSFHLPPTRDHTNFTGSSLL